MIVGPQECRHCSRAIYWAPAYQHWQHQNGNPRCYSPNGTANAAEPRTPKTGEPEREQLRATHRADTR